MKDKFWKVAYLPSGACVQNTRDHCGDMGASSIKVGTLG